MNSLNKKILQTSHQKNGTLPVRNAFVGLSDKVNIFLNKQARLGDHLLEMKHALKIYFYSPGPMKSH